MKLLVTGGSGFIGSNVVRLAIQRGYSIVNLDALTYASCLNNLEDISGHPNYAFEHADVRDKMVIEQIFNKHKPNAVMHLAAESHVDRSIDNPVDFIETNVMGTFNLLEVSRKYWGASDNPKSFRFHHVSTDEVFGSLTDEPTIKFTENTSYDPHSPYAASKAGSDHLVRAWYTTYGLPIVITNCSNNYGPYHFPEKLIPVVIISALEGKSIPIYGDGKHVRDWLFVEDHADALLLALETGEIGRSYNIGGENEFTNLEIAYKLCSIMDKFHPKSDGKYDDLVTFVADRPGHDTRYAIDPMRIRDELGWRPSVKIDEGLEKTVKWYLNNRTWWKALLNRNGVGERLGMKP